MIRVSSTCPIALRILLTIFARLASETNTPGQTRSISSAFDNTRGRFSTSSFSSSNALGERWVAATAANELPCVDIERAVCKTNRHALSQ